MQKRLYIFFILLGFLSLYTAHLLQDLLETSFVRAMAYALVVMFFVVAWQFLFRLRPESTEKPWARILVWIGSIGMGFWSVWVGLNIFYDLILSIFFYFSFPAGSYHWLPLAIFLFAALASLAGWISLWRGPQIKRVTIPFAGALKKFKLVQISDLHVGPTIRGAYVEKVVEKINALEPSVVVLTGDIVDGEPDILRKHLQALKKIRSTHGVFYVTGNHEFYWGAERWIEEFRALNCIVLNNENRVIDFNGVKILIAGVTDSHAEHFVPALKADIFAAAKTTELCSLKILLAHRPDFFLEAEKLGFHLQLSGHTHAGQYFPWNLLVRFFHRYYRGLEKFKSLWVYVNVGTGYWGPANRFGVPAEITEIVFS